MVGNVVVVVGIGGNRARDDVLAGGAVGKLVLLLVVIGDGL